MFRTRQCRLARAVVLCLLAALPFALLHADDSRHDIPYRRGTVQIAYTLDNLEAMKHDEGKEEIIDPENLGWDGLAAGGRELSSGIYFARLKVGGNDAIAPPAQKVMLLK